MVVADVDEAGAAAVAKEVGERAVSIGVDVRFSDRVKAMIDLAEQEFGGLDVLVNNAGLSRPRHPVEETPEEDFDFVLDVNLRGVFHGIRHGVPALRRRGGGVILNTSSIGAFIPRKGSSVYAMSKAAVMALTKGAALDLAPDIRINCVCPVASDTGFLAGTVSGSPEEIERKRAAIRAQGALDFPMGRLVDPDEVAAAFAFLASDDASFITGHALPVDGGRLAGDGNN